MTKKLLVGDSPSDPEDCSSVPPSSLSSPLSGEAAVSLEPSKGGPTRLGEIPVKDIIIVIFMLCLWLYSIALIVRAWAKIHNLPGKD